MTDQHADVWASGHAYEPYMGRWSRLVARDFLTWLQAGEDRRWLDVGCGTGALSSAVADRGAPRELVAVDPSEGFVGYASAHLPDNRAGFLVADGAALPFAPAAFEVTVSGLVLNFVPQPLVAVGEMARVTAPDGLVAGYVWDYAGEMQLLRRFWDAAVKLDHNVAQLDEGRRFPLCRPETLADTFRTAGLHNVEVTALDVPTHFPTFDDYWAPFLGGQGPAPGYLLSLSEERRAGLREQLRATLPTAPDGSIPLIARAWAVRGSPAATAS